MPSQTRSTFASTLLLLLLLSPLAPSAAQAPPPPTPKPLAPATAPMSKQQRKQLLASVDPMLRLVSHDTALPIHHRVKRKLISRQQITRYLNQRLNQDESAKRLQRSELVLKKFGLLDRRFDLQPFLITLLTEQIAGFYDSKSKTVNLLDWVAPAEQQPVLAHELTHALQDQDLAQTGGLDTWGDSGIHGPSTTLADDRRHLASDELESAREAVSEGQAMIVFFDDSLRASHRSVADVPEDTVLIDPDAEDASSPVMEHAPLLLRRSMLFPYSDGLRFEQVVLRRKGREEAFAGVLARPPSTSYEIIHPELWLAHATPPALALPNLHPLLDPLFAPFDVGAMGALDVRILGEILGGPPAAEELATAWDGGLYYAAQQRSATPAEQARTGSLALIYASRWRTGEAARSFAALYALGLHHKYTAVKRRSADETAAGEQIYTTSEGDAVLLTSGRSVLVTEGLPLDLARKLGPLFNASPAPPPEATGPHLRATLALPPHELALPFTHLLLRRAAHYTSTQEGSD